MADAARRDVNRDDLLFESSSVSTASRSLPPLPPETRSKSRKKRLIQKKAAAGEDDGHISSRKPSIMSHEADAIRDHSPDLDSEIQSVTNSENDRENRDVNLKPDISPVQSISSPRRKFPARLDLESDTSTSSSHHVYHLPNQQVVTVESHQHEMEMSPTSTHSSNSSTNRSHRSRQTQVKSKSQAARHADKPAETSQSQEDGGHKSVERKRSDSQTSADEIHPHDSLSPVHNEKRKSQTTPSRQRHRHRKKSIERSADDDIHKLDDEDDDLDTSVRNGIVMLPSLDLTENVTSESVGKIFVEHRRGFKAIPRTDRSLLRRRGPRSNARTLEELIRNTQKQFRNFCRFCHGLLAGLALWQCIVSYFLGPSKRDYMDFIRHYSQVSHIFRSLFYFLLIFCIISVFERYDIVHLKPPSLSSILSFPFWALTLLVYPSTLAVSLSISHLDDKLGLYQYNSTIWESMEEHEVESDIDFWYTLNLIRCIGALIGWLGVTISPKAQKKEDLLSMEENQFSLSNSITGPV